MIDFHPLTLADGAWIVPLVRQSDRRNCDFCFANLMSWRFLYDTEVALHRGMLVLRFRTNGHVAYQMPVGAGSLADVVADLIDDARQAGHAFLMLGVCDGGLERLRPYLPSHFSISQDRDYADYIYRREALATLAGKKLQAKRNFVNRFLRDYPDCRFTPLTPQRFAECLALERQWSLRKTQADNADDLIDERRSMQYVLDHWNDVGAIGGALDVGGRMVAFTIGAPINADTFDICVEKADADVAGAYAMVNREMARLIPPQYTYVNREEDLGVEGLRQAKLSYHPEIILYKYRIMSRHPMGGGDAVE